MPPKCSECGFTPPHDLLLDLAASPRKLRDGDFWICGECGAVLTVFGGVWRLATEKDMGRMGPGGRARIDVLQKRIKQARPS